MLKVLLSAGTRLHLSADFFHLTGDGQLLHTNTNKQTSKQASERAGRQEKKKRKRGEARGEEPHSVGVEASNKLGRSAVVPCTFKL